MGSSWIQGMENSRIQFTFSLSLTQKLLGFSSVFFPFVFHLFVKLVDKKQQLKSCYLLFIAKAALPPSCDMVAD